ncbi:hypothetical protein HQ487_05495 [Candidatus Uhrbacteria bacterium]|nr:hypothetical protein [Candidatus Uhrbacteria bacterium]
MHTQHLSRARTLVIAFIIALSPLALLAASSWPNVEATEIGQGVLAEPSGAVIHNNKLYVVDDGGYLAVMNPNGSQASVFTIGGDLEGVTTSDANGDLLYLGLERPDSIVEFNTQTNQKTGNSWDLTAFMQSADDNAGLEALTYANGLFYAGMQENGAIYVFRLSGAHTVEHINTIPSPTGYTDLSGLYYDGNVFWAIYDGQNIIASLSVNDLNAPSSFTVNEQTTLIGNDQEGVAILNNDLYIAEDSAHIWRYTGFITSPDPEPAPEPEVVPEPEVIPEPAPEPEVVPEPEVTPEAPDYSTAVSYKINKAERTITITYASGETLNISMNYKRAFVILSQDGRYVVVIDKHRLRVFEYGVQIR